MCEWRITPACHLAGVNMASFADISGDQRRGAAEEGGVGHKPAGVQVRVAGAEGDRRVGALHAVHPGPAVDEHRRQTLARTGRDHSHNTSFSHTHTHTITTPASLLSVCLLSLSHTHTQNHKTKPASLLSLSLSLYLSVFCFFLFPSFFLCLFPLFSHSKRPGMERATRLLYVIFLCVCVCVQATNWNTYTKAFPSCHEAVAWILWPLTLLNMH